MSFLLASVPTPQSWPCAVCDRPSVPRVHPGCQQRIADNLADLPALYRQLADALQPGRRGDGGRSGTRTAPLPCNTDALDLRARGGIEGVLGGWARDLCEREGWQIPQHPSIESIVDWGAGLLAANLNVLCDEHPAIREISDELRKTAAQARRLLDGEPAPRTIPLACPCGAVLRVTLDTPGRHCGGCGEQYDRSELFGLPLADRRQVAA
ncbi:hypothetical protein [Streptomyces sp. NPDC088674]|uniref:DUF7341 domain-containing protein n=1 Tax=Streptomyces sp. NPDC088674 TaxID=3365869 RepID=UPI003805143B